MQEFTTIKYRKPKSLSKWGADPWEVHYDKCYIGEVTKSTSDGWVSDASTAKYPTRDLAAFAMILAFSESPRVFLTSNPPVQPHQAKPSEAEEER